MPNDGNYTNLKRFPVGIIPVDKSSRLTFYLTGLVGLWNYSFYMPVCNFIRIGLRTTP